MAAKKDIYTELGRIGQHRYGGFFYEEFLKELQGRKGIEVYKEMADNDDIIGALLFAIEMLLRQVKWDIKSAGNSKYDDKASEFIYSCMFDMDETWSDFISEVLSFLVYGWSYHEIVYKRRMGSSKNPMLRSKHNDGLIGWRKLPIRSQDSLWEWVYDDNDNMLGMMQCAPPSFKQLFIPIEKALHFKTKSRKSNPEGRSILRNAYRCWYFKRRIQEIEGIGIERDLAGLPVLEAPEGLDIWDTSDVDMARVKAASDEMVKNIRRDQMEGVSMPSGWKLSLLTTGGARQFDTNAVIERYDNRIAMTALADFVLLGHEGVGSFALSSDKTKLFAVALGTFLDLICEVFNNQAIPRLIEMNKQAFSGISGYPELIHNDIETPNLKELGSFIKDMASVGIIMPDENLENHMRMVANLPECLEESGYMSAVGKKTSNAYKGCNEEAE